MSNKDHFPKYPAKVRASMERPDLFYVRVPGYYAVHGLQSDGSESEAVFSLDEGDIKVFRGGPDEAKRLSTSAILSPVYAIRGKGQPAVPTGLVFIRFSEGVEVGTRREAISRAGYEVDETLPYAPHAAWLRAGSGEISDALNQIHTLDDMPDVENVEPQMLMEGSRRLQAD